MGYGRFIIKRLLQLIPSLIGLSILVFLILHMVPGDPATILAGPEATAEDVEYIRKQMGLDKPLLVQYFDWLGRVLQGDLGRSIYARLQVTRMLIPRLLNTIELTVVSALTATISGILIGVISALKRGSIFDYVTMTLAVLGICIPSFWLGLMLIEVFSLAIPLFPVAGRGGVEHLVLPAMCLVAYQTPILARMMRSTMLDVLGQDYIRTAKSKGLPQRVVLYKHALKNALIPVVTIIGIQIGYMLGGTVIVETIFAWPGIGKQLVDSIFLRDYPMVQGALLIYGTSFMLLSLAVDFLYGFIDPRIRV